MAETKLAPTEGQYVNVGDLRMYYEKYGSGEPLVLVHGGTVESSYMWGKFVPVFSKHFRVIAPDSRGHGKTHNPTGELSFRQMADDTAGLIKALGLEKPSIVGYSDGGQVCLEVGIHHPNIASMLVVGGAHNRMTADDTQSLRKMGIEAPGIVDSRQFEETSQRLVTRIKETFTAYGPEYWKAYLEQISKPWLTPPNYTAEDYGKITVPTLILVGDRDESVILEDALEMYKSIPKAELAIVPASDHYFPWSKPDLFANTIVDFLQRQSVPTQGGKPLHP